MIKFFKSALFVIASVVVGICIGLLPKAAGPVSITYISVLSIYLGIDIADTIIKSAQLPRGEYKNIHTHKYIVSFSCLIGLIVVCFFSKYQTEISTALTSLVSSVLIVIGMLIGVLEGNKIATNKGIESNAEVTS